MSTNDYDIAAIIRDRMKVQPQVRDWHRLPLDPKNRESHIMDLLKSKEQLNKVIPDQKHAVSMSFIIEDQNVHMLHMTMRSAVMLFMALLQQSEPEKMVKTADDIAGLTDSLLKTSEDLQKQMQRDYHQSFRDTHLKRAIALCSKVNAAAKQVKAAGRGIKTVQLEKIKRDMMDAMQAYMDASAACHH